MSKMYKNIGTTWQPIKNVYKSVNGTWCLLKKVYKNVSGVWELVHNGYIVVDNNIDAYDVYASGYMPYYDDKGELFMNASGVLQASDGSRLGKLIDVWFTSDTYAINATAFYKNCYVGSDNRRIYDNKAWAYGTYSTGTETSSNCDTCNCDAATCECERTIYYNNYAWR